jgi:small subunit ribosomal protein S16
MLMMRLQRIGRKNEPHFRVVITDRRNATKSGKFNEVVGSYNPKSGAVVFNAEKTKSWLAAGAQPSATVYNYLVAQKFLEGKKKNVLPKKSPTVKRKDAKKK